MGTQCLPRFRRGLPAWLLWVAPTCGAQTAALEEIIVSSRKVDEALGRLEASLSLANAKDLQVTATHDLVQLAELIPGMVFSRAPDDGLALTLRGIGTPARAQAFDQSVALYLDDVFLAKGRLYPQAIFDLERVEVLKGPQTVRLGRNATAGAITLVPRDPGDELSVDLQVSQGLEAGGQSVEAAADLPLAQGTVARLALQYLDGDGWVRNQATGRRGPEDSQNAARLTLQSDLAEGVAARLRLQRASSRRIGQAMQLIGLARDGSVLPYETRLDDRSRALTPYGQDGEPVHETDSTLASLGLEGSHGELRLVSESSYLDFDADYVDDLDFSESAHVDFLRDEDYRQFSQEFRLHRAGPDATFDYLLGANFFDSDWHSLETQIWATPGFPPGTPLAGELFNGPFSNDFHQATRSHSVFGVAGWRPLPDWKLSLGLRWSDDRKDVVYGRNALEPLTLWNTRLNPPFPATPLRFDERSLDGEFSVAFSPSDAALWYASIAKATKPGGFVETNGVASGDPARDALIASEVSTAVELGARYVSGDGRLRLSGALFDLRIEDFQDTTFDGTAFVTLNLPARTRGAEFELDWQPGAGWHVALGATLADATQRFGGQEYPMTQAPRWTGNLQLEYQRPLSETLDVRLRTDLRHRARMYSQRGGLFPAESFTPLGAAIGLLSRDRRWGVELIGRNLGNATTADFSGPTPDPFAPTSAAPARFRTVVLRGWFLH
jgi:iron complex outermembrane receptor protein